MKPTLEDLSARARRGELSDAELHQLSLYLESSFEARLAHRAGLEFDAQDSVRPTDGEIVDRVTRRLLEMRPKPAARKRRLWVLLAAALLSATAFAFAAPQAIERGERWLGLEPSAPRAGSRVSAPRVGPAKIAEPAPSVAEAARAAPAREPKESEPLAARPPQANPANGDAAPSSRLALEASSMRAQPRAAAAATPSAAGAGSSEASNAATKSAASLFAEANRARREGRVALAIELYASLEQRYPNTSESKASDIAVGMLNLERGSQKLALDHFVRYLDENPHAELAPEALWGKAQALAGLGQREAARRSLVELLERYPQSAYANAARAKLRGEP